MTFGVRDRTHAEHKRDVVKALRARGFLVEETGFELLSVSEQQELTRKWPGELRRWWPDLRAIRGAYGELWVDAKSDLSETAYYSIELAALACYGAMEARLRRSVVLVWPGGRCNYSCDLTPVTVHTRGGTRGSDTAYVLVRRDAQKHFDDIFGQVDESIDDSQLAA